MIIGIRTLALYVGDTQRSRTFYEDALGLPHARDRDGRVELDVHGIRLLLHPTETDAVDRAEARHGRTEVYFTVEDVDETLERLRRTGTEVVEEPADRPWGERDAAVLDPDGFTVHLTQVLG